MDNLLQGGNQLQVFRVSGRIAIATQNPRVGIHKINQVAKVIRRHKNTLRGFWDDYQSRR